MIGAIMKDGDKGVGIVCVDVLFSEFIAGVLTKCADDCVECAVEGAHSAQKGPIFE